MDGRAAAGLLTNGDVVLEDVDGGDIADSQRSQRLLMLKKTYGELWISPESDGVEDSHLAT